MVEKIREEGEKWVIKQGLEGGVWISNHGLNFSIFTNHATFSSRFTNHVVR